MSAAHADGMRASPWLLAVIVSVLAACAPTRDAAAISSLASLSGSEWRLVEGLEGVDLSQVEITLAFQEGGRVGGSGGCNQYGADASLKEGAFRLGPVAATKRGCLGPRGRAEPMYFSALAQVDTLARDGEALVLSGGGQALRFAPAGAAQR